MAYKKYSDTEQAEAMVRLAVNKYNYTQTSEQTGIPEKTLRRWDKLGIKKTVPQLLERAIERMLMNIPADWKGNDWAIALGILMDKWLLVQGKATSRTESSVMTMLQNIPDSELNELIREFEAAASQAPAAQNGKSEA